LLSSVSALGSCGSCDTAGPSYDNESCDCSSFVENLVYDEYVDKISGFYAEDRSRKVSLIPRPMISFEQTPRNNSCLPYYQFTDAVEFCATIPNGKKLKEAFLSNDLKLLEKLASKADCFQNYDALNAFYFNADCNAGVTTLQFSSSFITFFLLRFNYYLQLVYADLTATVNGSELISISTKKPIDLLDLPSKFNDISFGNEANTLRIFNMIISDTTITKVASDFITILQKQINTVTINTTNKKGSSFNTFLVYSTVLQAYLAKTKEIVQANLQQKINFISGQKQFAFALMAISVAISNTDPLEKIIAIADIDTTQYMTVNNTARFI